jgi:hypothetical protein
MNTWNPWKIKIFCIIKEMTKPFWDLEESVGFVKVRSTLDSLEYKVWNTGTDSEKLEVANILAMVRQNINILLIYLARNPELWLYKNIAFGIIHTFDLHIPCLYSLLESLNTDSIEVLNQKIIDKCVKDSTLFTYQEITPNDHGIIGLNKPKVIKTIQINVDEKVVDYEIAEKRLIMLTIRKKSGKFDSIKEIMDLAIHELTHTTCNDVRWKPDNHKPPYTCYHRLMRKWAKECGIL